MTTSKHARATIVAIASIAFALGCVTEALIIPPVRAGTNPMRWEYKYLEHMGRERAETVSNQMGAEGWELVQRTSDEALWCFKRPLP